MAGRRDIAATADCSEKGALDLCTSAGLWMVHACQQVQDTRVASATLDPQRTLPHGWNHLCRGERPYVLPVDPQAHKPGHGQDRRLALALIELP